VSSKKKAFMDESTEPNEQTEKLADKTSKIKEAAGEAVDQARRTAQTAWVDAKNKINLEPLTDCFRENPVRTMAVTFAIGFIAGLLCRKER
jgi:ElaB/YqjD/DUF883 family membrane-anchored ribosome-binding protein